MTTRTYRFDRITIQLSIRKKPGKPAPQKRRFAAHRPGGHVIRYKRPKRSYPSVWAAYRVILRIWRQQGYVDSLCAYSCEWTMHEGRIARKHYHVGHLRKAESRRRRT